ncbi:MAG: hypothetical protein HYY93_00110 [Planctomycetes bacterium]|nr:hypothetical protein [Planctomycetota bacterium]
MRLSATLGFLAVVGIAGGCCNTGYQHFVPRPTWGPHSTGPVIHPDCPHCEPTPAGRCHDHRCAEWSRPGVVDTCHTCGRAKSTPRGNCSCNCHTGG